MRIALLALLAATYVINASAAAPSQNDSRKVYGSDPRIAWKSYPTGKYRLQVANSMPDKVTVPEPGWRDPKMGDYVVMRTTDPTNGSKKAYRHRIKKGMTYKDGSTARAESHANWGSSTTLKLGVPYWAVYAFYADADHPFNGSGDDLNILELGHGVTSKNGLPHIAFFLRRNGTLDAMVSSNNVLNGTTKTRRTTKVFAKSVQKKVWHYIVVQFKLEWDAAKKPYFRVWHAVGNGSPVQVCNTTIANAYRETATYTPQKYGLYQWNLSNWGTSTTRTTFTKGLHVFLDKAGTPALSVGSLLEYARAI
jgi:hypothetical protein